VPKLLQLSQFTIPNGGFSYPFGQEKSFWASLAVDTVIGQSGGPSALLQVNGQGPEDEMTVLYGSSLTRKFRGKLLRLSPAGVIVELYVADEEVAVASVAVTPPNAIIFPNAGVAPSDGEITVHMIGTGSIPTVQEDEGGANPMDTANLEAATGKIYTVPVRGGHAYGFAGGTFVRATHKTTGTS
jgi:hypothetical protein